jgi:hypothetical protein
MIPVGYAQATLLFSGNAVPTGAAVVLGLKNEIAQSANDVASDVLNAVSTSGILGRLTTDITLSGIQVKLGPDVNGAYYAAGVSGLAGGSPGDSNPNTSLLVAKNTASGGRANRGRSFWPGVIEADVAQGGVLTATGLAQYQTQCAAFLTQLATNSVPMAILHEWKGVPTPLPGDPVLVTSYTPSNRVATQRRRLRR